MDNLITQVLHRRYVVKYSTAAICRSNFYEPRRFYTGTYDIKLRNHMQTSLRRGNSNAGVEKEVACPVISFNDI
ncbi:hypothetical protein C0J52_21935 [Blattella germanica]|nr:hypothetical protein C0J52_21935 [Blattella germanica]